MAPCLGAYYALRVCLSVLLHRCQKSLNLADIEVDRGTVWRSEVQGLASEDAAWWKVGTALQLFLVLVCTHVATLCPISSPCEPTRTQTQDPTLPAKSLISQKPLLRTTVGSSFQSTLS